MDSLDLSRLDGGDGVRRGLAARFDEAMRQGGIVVLESHGLDTELLELAGTFGRRLLAHAELREVFAEHRVAMLGVAQRVLALAGVALGQSPALFADRFTGAPRVELTLQESSSGPPSRGLLGLRQEANGRLLAWIGPQFARIAADRYPLPEPPPLPRGALALRLHMASPVLGAAVSFAPAREISRARAVPDVVHGVVPLLANRATPVMNAT